MKNLSRFFFAGAIILFLFSSCQQDELTISNLTAGNHDGGIEVPIGGTISVDFEAIAGEARLDFYHIEIHDHPESGLVDDEYRIIDADFRDVSTFKGLRNAHVHEHIVVPQDAHLGEYHVVVVVVDEDGNSVDTEDGDAHIIVVE
jgi:hypothetical protein